MSPLRVSEKTLELNICAEVLYVIRQIPGCHGGFWIGMKQQQEARLGIDELIRNIPAGMHLALQFKAPRSEPRDQIPYRFTINDKQNNNLLRLASSRPEAVYYIFPHYNTFTKMHSDSPTLLRDTWLLRVDDLRGLSNSANKLGTHMVETNPPIQAVQKANTVALSGKVASFKKSLFLDLLDSLNCSCALRLDGTEDCECL